MPVTQRLAEVLLMQAPHPAGVIRDATVAPDLGKPAAGNSARMDLHHGQINGFRQPCCEGFVGWQMTIIGQLELQDMAGWGLAPG